MTPRRIAGPGWPDHEDTDLVEVFDTSAGRWSRAAAAPTARNSAASAVIDGKVYVVGGRQAIKQPDGSLRQVNVATLEVFGGEQWVPEHKVFSDSWVYDPATDRWSALPSLPMPRHGLGAATLGNRIHVFGGGLTVGGNAASAVHEVLAIGQP